MLGGKKINGRLYYWAHFLQRGETRANEKRKNVSAGWPHGMHLGISKKWGSLSTTKKLMLRKERRGRERLWRVKGKKIATVLLNRLRRERMS